MLSRAALSVLTALRDLAAENAKAPSRGELVKRAGVEPGDLDALVDDLKAEGLVTRLASAVDPKWTPTVVTVLGHELLADLARSAAGREVAA